MPQRLRRLRASTLTLTLGLAACAPLGSGSPAGSPASPDVGGAAATVPAAPLGVVLPGPAHPGALNPQVTQETIHATICSPGWTATVRPPAAVTERLKRADLEAAGNPYRASQTEYDHVVPLELGGLPLSLGADGAPAPLQPNLWNQPHDGIVGAGHGSETKDLVENYLNHQVCRGGLTLSDAQADILHWWSFVDAVRR